MKEIESIEELRALLAQQPDGANGLEILDQLLREEADPMFVAEQSAKVAKVLPLVFKEGDTITGLTYTFTYEEFEDFLMHHIDWVVGTQAGSMDILDSDGKINTYRRFI